MVECGRLGKVYVGYLHGWNNMLKPLAGGTVRLTPKTNKAKNRIREWGDNWTIREVRGNIMLVFALSDDSGTDNLLPTSVRWINILNDEDFNIEVLE